MPAPKLPGPAKQQALSAVTVGASGTSFRYVSTLGETETPYLVDTNHLNRPRGLFIDRSTGALFVTEQQGKRVLKYDADKNNLLAIGKAGVGYTDDYIFSQPDDVTIAPDGHIWVADWSRIVEYSATGDFIRNFPETDPWASGSDNDRFENASGLAFDANNHLFVADRYNHRVQVFTWDSSTGLTYLATIGKTDQPGNEFDQFNEPNRVEVLADGTAYVTDVNNARVMRCVPGGDPIAWTCTPFYTDLDHPEALAIGPDGAVYIGDNWRGRIVKCTGDTCSQFAQDIWPSDLAVASNGFVYAAREYDCTVEFFFTNGVNLGVHLGVLNTGYLTDNEHFNTPRVHFDAQGNMLVLEEAGQRLLKFAPDGTFLWSFGEAGHDSWDNNHLNWPHGLDTDAAGNIYIADNWRVQFFTKDGVYQNTWGSYPDQPNPTYSWVSDVGVDPGNGNVYVVDTDNQRVAAYNSTGVYLGQIGETDVCGNDNQHLCRPHGVDVDASGNIYIADSENHRVQIFNRQRVYQATLGTTGEANDAFDHFGHPEDVMVDSKGRIFVTDMWNNRVQVFNSNYAYLTTIGGNWGSRTGDFRAVSAVSMAPSGALYISDINNQRIDRFVQGTPGWLQKNVNGFGTKGTFILSMEAHNGTLYAGLTDWTGYEQFGVWASTDGRTWTQAAAPGVITSPDQPAVISMQSFGDYLYAGTGWGNVGAKVWRYDGSTWTEVISHNIPGGFTAMTVFNGQIYAAQGRSPENGGALIWRSTTGSLNEWEETTVTGMDASAETVNGFAEFQGQLYATAQNYEDGYEVWRLPASGSTWTRILTGGNGDSALSDIGGMAVFNGELYLGAPNGVLYKTPDGDTWSVAVADGFGDPDNGKIDGLIVIDETLYAIINNDKNGLQVWATADGSQWQMVSRDGLGNINNTSPFWNNTTVNFQGSLYFGAWNGVTGGQVWQMLPYMVYLPATRR